MIGGKVMKFTMGIVYGGGADEDLKQICVADSARESSVGAWCTTRGRAEGTYLSGPGPLATGNSPVVIFRFFCIPVFS